MKLCRVVGGRLIHKVIVLPSLSDEYVLATGRKGLACGTDHGFLFAVEELEGEEEDITCRKCLASV